VSPPGVEQIANAVLYEGYILYPYRASSVKNRRRFNFGVLAPPSYSAAQYGTEASAMRTECLITGTRKARLAVRVRFLQVMPGSWQEAMERDIQLAECSLDDLLSAARHDPFQYDSISGVIAVSAAQVQEGVYRVAVEVSNDTPIEAAASLTRDEALPYSLAAAHTILTVADGELVSLLDPPDELRVAVGACHNQGTWPVLAGAPDQRRCMLSSPIILYDYPRIAPESPGDLFDGTEIDEILTLRIMTLTEEEKQEIRNGDARGRRMLERTELLPEEHLQKLHGALRGLRPAEESR